MRTRASSSIALSRAALRPRPRWWRAPSPTCSPIVRTGFRLEPGSLENDADVATGAKGGRARPVQDDVALYHGLAGSRPVSASARVLLPQPLSPMIASFSPTLIVEADRLQGAVHAGRGPVGDGEPLDAAKDILHGAPPADRQGFDQPLAKQVYPTTAVTRPSPGMIDRKDAERSRFSPVGDHPAPGDRVRITEPEKRQRSLDQHRCRDDDGDQRQHRRQRVGQHLAKRRFLPDACRSHRAAAT